MKKIIITSIISVFCMLGLSSCIDETFPTEYAIDSQIQSSPTALKSMVNAIPTNMIGWENASLEICGYPGLCAAFEEMTQDVVIAGTTGYNTWGTYSAMSNPVHNRQNYAWYMHYGYIRNCNSVIGMIDKNTTDKAQQYYLGIAHTFRALYYLNLVRMFEYKHTPLCEPENNDVYGLGVPIVTEETTEEQAKNNPRVKVENNYEMIFSDLAKAEQYFGNDYDAENKAFPSLACVYGLYARAYLERGTAGVSGAFEKAAEYARRAITESGCTPLSREQWEDPVNGFNNANSQNSWMWGVVIAPDNVSSMVIGSFYGLMMAEQTWIVYGWRVGRSISRRLYEAIPDNDFRKYSWLDPAFYGYKDKNGNDVPASDSYNGYTYKLAMPAERIRSNMTVANGFNGYPWIYNPIKFRPSNGNWSTDSEGAAMDYPLMRVEEMYLIEAEATARSKGLASGVALLNDFMKYRILDGSYDCTAKCTNVDKLVDEIILQKRIELWGEGILWFDNKRLELGLHRGYKGINASVYSVTFDIDGIVPIWNCRIPEAEKQGNPAMILNPTPLNANTLNIYWTRDNNYLKQYYGCDLNNPDGN